MGNIKSLLSLLVGFMVVHLLGIAGFFAMFFMNIPGTDSLTNRGLFAIATGIPLGSSLGILITKMFLFRTGKFSVLCLFTSLVFGVLATLLYGELDFIRFFRSKGLTFYIFCVPLVPLFALIGYNAMAVLLRGKN